MDLYTDKNGKQWVQIRNFWSLHSEMLLKYGKKWKNQCLKSYGYEQLFENQYNLKGVKC